MPRKKKTKKPASKSPSYDSDALIYHEYESLDQTKRLPGKLEVVASKAFTTQRDLSLAYTPGVAAPCLEIAKNSKNVSRYTGRANLVAVVSNGSAVLGLGNIGPMASKPVMEGKAILFKRFANVNVFDLEINAPSVEEMVAACRYIEPTVGGINLEDIKSPECFEVEEQLKKSLKIPVFHDDQHGTAIILVAALLNALKIGKKKASSIKVVFSGAGAAAIACARLIIKAGVKKSNIIMCDKDGVIHSGRKDIDKYKAEFASSTKMRTLSQALKGADVFVGLSVGNVVSKSMVKKMAKNPIIFAMANPTPEIPYEDAKSERPDAIVATGRSDYPNQINNVLGFPYIFRGALDVESTAINDEMKLAAARALAALTREDVPESVSRAYGGDYFSFGPDYIIPKPFDQRALYWVAPAVAEAAMKSKVAGRKIDLEEYRDQLRKSVDRSHEIIGASIYKAKRQLRRIVFPEGDLPQIVRAAHILKEEALAKPVLLSDKQSVQKIAKAMSIDLKGIDIVDAHESKKKAEYADIFYRLRQRKGMSQQEAAKLMDRRTYFGLMMLEQGEADGLVSGLSKSYPETIRPALQIIQLKEQYRYAAGLYIILMRDRIFFFADTTVNIEPDAECLAEIALQVAERVELFDIEPRVAFLSFSNFGSAPHPVNTKISAAIDRVRSARPDLKVDGEMQADTAVTDELMQRYPFCQLEQAANVLIFPNLAAGNIAYKLLQRLGHAEVIGPVLMGPRKPVHILQQGSSVEEIVNMATIAAAEANYET